MRVSFLCADLLRHAGSRFGVVGDHRLGSPRGSYCGIAGFRLCNTPGQTPRSATRVLARRVPGLPDSGPSQPSVSGLPRRTHHIGGLAPCRTARRMAAPLPQPSRGKNRSRVECEGFHEEVVQRPCYADRRVGGRTDVPWMRLRSRMSRCEGHAAARFGLPLGNRGFALGAEDLDRRLRQERFHPRRQLDA